MLPQQDIQKYGGKAAILDHIREKLPDMPMPRYVVMEFGQNLDSILPEFDSMNKPVIVRSSSPHEYADFEGIFESVHDVKDRSALSRAVREVERSATSERAQEYAKQNGFSIDRTMHKIIGEQSGSKFVGAMMRHPNNPDLIFINYSSGSGKYLRDHSRFVFDERTWDEAELDSFSSLAMPKEHAEFLVGKYKQLEKLTEIAEGHSLYVEFGFNPFALYQVRPYKKIETSNFEVPKIENETSSWTDFCFGITPPEGLVLPVVRGVGWTEAILYIDDVASGNKRRIKFEGEDMNLYVGLHNIGGLMRIRENIDIKTYLKTKLRSHNLSMGEELGQQPFAYLTSTANNDEYDVDLSVPGMKALAMGDSQNFLVHGLMRLMKKADVTLCIDSFVNEGTYQNTKSLDDKVRIISNGKEAAIIREG